MMIRSEIFEILKKYKHENAKKYGIKTLGIFGSFSRDEAKDESDVDIVIETTTPDLFKLVHIKDELEKLLHKTVDIVRNREKMNPYLKSRIKKEAVYV
jgi:predicted nucleotidyltransferase